MGRIKVKFKATHKGASTINNGLVDTGADLTIINMDTACRLGLDQEHASIESVQGFAGGTVRCYVMRNVKIETNGRSATLPKVLVQAAKVDPRGKFRKLADNAEQLIGHDFLQASKSIVDFEDDNLRGVAARSITTLRPRMRPRRVPNQAAARKTLRQLFTCPVNSTRRKTK